MAADFGSPGSQQAQLARLILGSNQTALVSNAATKSSQALLTINATTGPTPANLSVTVSVGEPGPFITFNYTYASTTDSGNAQVVRFQIQRSDGAFLPNGEYFFFDSGWMPVNIPSGGNSSYRVNAVDAGIPTDTGSGSADPSLHLAVVLSVSEVPNPTTPGEVASSTSMPFDVQWGVATSSWTEQPAHLISNGEITADWIFTSTRGFSEAYWEATLTSVDGSTIYWDSGFQSGSITALPALSQLPNMGIPPYVLVNGVSYQLTVLTYNTNEIPAAPLISLFVAGQVAPSGLVGGSFLQRFLGMLAFQLDVDRSLVEQLRFTSDPQRCPGNLLPALAQQLGVSYEAEMGMAQTRKLLSTIVHQYKMKGTSVGVEGISSAVTGWPTVVAVGDNLSLGPTQLPENPTTPTGLGAATNLGTLSAPVQPSTYVGTGWPTTWPVTSPGLLPNFSWWALSGQSDTIGGTTDNLLSPVDASFEGSVGTWVSSVGVTAVGLSALAALDGSDSLSLELSGAAGISWAQTTNYPVTAEASYVVMAAFRPVSNPESVFVDIESFNGGTFLGDLTTPQVAEIPGVWRYATGVVTMPATTNVAVVSARFNGSPSQPLAAPAAPTVTPTGTAGTTSYSYEVTYTNQYGETVASASASTSTGNAALSSTNYNTVAWAMPPQNLIPDSSFEDGTTGGWLGVGTGVTLANSTAEAHTGVHSLLVTWAAGAAGSQGVYCSVPCQAGVPYVASAWVYVPTGDPAVVVQLVNEGVALLATSAASSANGEWTRLSAVGVTQAGQTYVALQVVLNATATAGQLVYVDDIQLETPTNLLSPAASSFEDGSTGGWLGANGSTVANSTAEAYDGTHSLAWTNGATAISATINVAYTPAISWSNTSEEFTGQIWVYSTAAFTANCMLAFENSSGVTNTVSPAATSVAANTWTLLTASGTAASGTTTAYIELEVSSAAASQVIYIDSAMGYAGPAWISTQQPSAYQEITTKVYGRSGTLGLLATSYGTSYNDTGAATPGAAAPTTNTTGETHYVDCAGIFPGDTLGYQLEVLSDGPAAYFPLTDAAGSATARNAVGSGDGTVVGGVTFGEPGVVASDPSQTAALFDGSSGAIQTGLTSNTSTFTIEAWVKSNNIAANYPRILCTQNYYGSKTGFGLVQSGGSLEFDTGNGTGIDSLYWVQTPGWHHVVGQYNGTNMLLYVDGVLFASSAPVTYVPSLNEIQIGFDGGSAFFPGTIAHVAVYPTALSAARIAAHYQAALNTAGQIVQKWTPGGQTAATVALNWDSLRGSTPLEWGVPLSGALYSQVSVGMRLWAADFTTAPNIGLIVKFWDQSGEFISSPTQVNVSCTLNAWTPLQAVNIAVPSNAVWLSYELVSDENIQFSNGNGVLIVAAPQVEPGKSLSAYTPPRQVLVALKADRTNLIANPSFENGNTNGWTAVSNCSISAVTGIPFPVSNVPNPGTYSMQVTSTGPGAMSVQSDWMPVDSVLLYIASVYVQAEQAPEPVELTLIGRGPKGTTQTQTVTSRYPAVGGGTTSTMEEVAGAWVRPFVDFDPADPISSGITEVSLLITWTETQAGGENHIVDAVLFEEGWGQPQPYFDADIYSGAPQAPDYLWTDSTNKVGPSYFYRKYSAKLSRLGSVLSGLSNDPSLAQGATPLTITGFLPLGMSYSLLTGPEAEPILSAS